MHILCNCFKKEISARYVFSDNLVLGVGRRHIKNWRGTKERNTDTERRDNIYKYWIRCHVTSDIENGNLWWCTLLFNRRDII